MRLEDADAIRRSAALETARHAVRRIERTGRAARSRVAFGWDAPDRALGGGLEAGVLHEIAGTSAVALALRLAGRIQGAVLWCHPVARSTALYGPGLEAVAPGLTDRLVVARARGRADSLWAAEEALRSGAVGAVVLEPAERGPLGLTASRRLHLAAGRGGALGLVLPGPTEAEAALAPGAVATRWRVTPGPSTPSGRPRWCLTLTRRREGGEGTWTVEG